MTEIMVMIIEITPDLLIQIQTRIVIDRDCLGAFVYYVHVSIHDGYV